MASARQAEVVALSLGHRGALLITADDAFRAHAPDVHVVSAVGAGDSFLGAMVRHLACGASLVEAFRYGVAAGSAAVLNPRHGTLPRFDITRLYNEIQIESLAGPPA